MIFIVNFILVRKIPQVVQDEDNGPSRETFLDSIDIPKLSEDGKAILEKPLCKQELYDVIKSMKLNKTPGFDGLPIEFYIVFWPDICDMLMNSFNFSLQNGAHVHITTKWYYNLASKEG